MQKPQNVGATLKRIFRDMAASKGVLAAVFLSILCSALAQIIGTSFLQRVIDNYLEPMLKAYNAELMTGFIRTLFLMGGIYLIGALSTYFYQRVMLSISTRTLFRIRTDMFAKMEHLPIRFFDTHAHGDLMSRYTNDTDTIREMLSNTVTQFISSSITVIGVFIMMLY